ncbi:ComEC/Rec2 family competence protein [bacterium]|nr:ComEC/Rec2 family competence protein [bacterium]
MILFSLLIISLLAVSIFRFSVYEILSDVTKKSHQFCISNLPENSPSIAELKALVCAENFTNLNDSQFYISSGLIHLFVVSGAHLIVIENFLLKASHRYKLPALVILVTLTLYAFACGLSAPVVRCLIAFTLSYYLRSKNIYWPAHLRLLVIGILTLVFNFQWVSSLGLQMSWIAAFLVALGAHFFEDRSLIFKQSLFYFALLPSITFFQTPSPVVILCNVLLAPVLELILFPLGLMVWFFNFLHPVFDHLIGVLKLIISTFEIEFRIQSQSFPPQLIFYNWVFIFLLHGVFHIVYVYQKRKALD